MVGELLKMTDGEYFSQHYGKYLSKSRLWKFRQDPCSVFKEQVYDENKQHFVMGSAFPSHDPARGRMLVPIQRPRKRLGTSLSSSHSFYRFSG